VTIASLPDACASGSPLAGRPLVATEGSGRFDLFPAGNTTFPIGAFPPAVATAPSGAGAFGTDTYADGNERAPSAAPDGIRTVTTFPLGPYFGLEPLFFPLDRTPAADPGNKQPIDASTFDPLTRGPAGAAVDPAFESLSRRMVYWAWCNRWVILPEEAVTGGPVACGQGEPTVPVPPGLFNDLMPGQPVPPGLFGDLIPLQPVPPGLFNDLLPRPAPFFALDFPLAPLAPAPPAATPPPAARFWFFSEDNTDLLLRAMNPPADSGKYWVFMGAMSEVELKVTVTDEERSRNIITAPFSEVPARGR
jgi:hypothetical protein